MILRVLERLRHGRRGPEFNSALDPPGRVYAIGDVHGSADLLETLLDRIEAECRTDAVGATLVMMGDYIDRGDASRRVLEMLPTLGQRTGLDPVLLRGNHEELLLDFLDGEDEDGRWLRFGGLQTLLSYGISGPAALGGALQGSGYETLRQELAGALGRHVELLRELESSYQTGNVFFAHAGADPSRPLDLQSHSALVWGAPGFRDRPRSDGNWVVYGHYIVEDPMVENGRIGIDTGAYFSQRLTAVRLETGSAPAFLTASMDE